MIFLLPFLAVASLFGAKAQDHNTARADVNEKECNQHRVWKKNVHGCRYCFCFMNVPAFLSL